MQATVPSLDPILSAQAGCKTRQERLQSILEQHGIEGLLISNPTDICYLTSFHGDESLAVVTGSGAWVVSDSRFENELAGLDRQATGASVIMGIRHKLNDAIRDHLKSLGVRRLGVQAEVMPVAEMEADQSRARTTWSRDRAGREYCSGYAAY